MVFGSPKDKIDFSKFETSGFLPYLENDYRWETCGSACLSMITGQKAGKIEKNLPKNRKHWTDTSLSNYLVRRGYFVKQVTQMSVLASKFWLDAQITEYHVLIANCRVDKYEGSYFLLWNNNIWHNYEKWDNTMFLINNPIQNLMLIWHKNWS